MRFEELVKWASQYNARMSVRYLIIGGLREDYCITHDGRARSGVLGGNAVYAATGAALWSDSVGILGRVGSNFPLSWLEQIAAAGLVQAASRCYPTRRTPELSTPIVRSTSELIRTQTCITNVRGFRFPKRLRITSPPPRGSDRKTASDRLRSGPKIFQKRRMRRLPHIWLQETILLTASSPPDCVSWELAW